MARTRRFNVDSLHNAEAQAPVTLPEAQRRHVHVLRLKPGDEVEVFDGEGRVWRARLDQDRSRVFLIEAHQTDSDRPRLLLATAWPKGKRSATLVEKCAELGVDEIVPLRCARSVVNKDAEGAGHERLCRIAAEAAKQSGRADVPVITADCTIAQLLDGLPVDTHTILVDPRADMSLIDVLGARPEADHCLMVGPEGGFTEEEYREALGLGAQPAQLGANVLRVETAAIAVCALAALM